jgi:hypothetical protein
MQSKHPSQASNSRKQRTSGETATAEATIKRRSSQAERQPDKAAPSPQVKKHTSGESGEGAQAERRQGKAANSNQMKKCTSGESREGAQAESRQGKAATSSRLLNAINNQIR